MKFVGVSYTLALVLLTGFASGKNDTTNWPQFRGPLANGIATSTNLPDRWSAGANGLPAENVAWKTDLPGRGWSSPIVWGRRIFVTTVIGELDAPRKGLYFGGNRSTPPAAQEWRVICLDLNSGKVVWEKSVHRGNPLKAIHLKNSFASETPVTDGERLYACFGNLGLWCLDFAGKELWSRKLEPHKMRFDWGTAASPVLHKERIYLVNDNDEQSYLLALNKRTGKEIWRLARDEKSNWATPFIWEHAQRTEIVTSGSSAVRSYDLDGKLLWQLKGMSSITIATPYAGDGLLYITSGYVGDRLRPVYAIRPGASGDISLDLNAGQTSNSHVAWCNPTAGPYNPSTLMINGRLYVLFDRGMVSCHDARTGALKYDKERLPNGLHFTSSPWAANGKLFCQNEDGVTFVLREGDTFEALHTNRLADDDMCMATPAIAGDRLIIRTSARVYCIRKPS